MANTAIDLKNGADNSPNVVYSAAINSTENTLTLSITPGFPRTIQMVSADAAWYYRATSGGTNLAVAIAQTLTLIIPANDVIYFQRQTGDGTLTLIVLV